MVRKSRVEMKARDILEGTWRIHNMGYIRKRQVISFCSCFSVKEYTGFSSGLSDYKASADSCL